MMILKAPKTCSTRCSGETLEKTLIRFEEEVSTSLSPHPPVIHPAFFSNSKITQKEASPINQNNNNNDSCSCEESDRMRLYSNNQNRFGSYIPPSHRYYYSHLTTKRKLLFLVFVASLALLSIVLISEQLISRHFGRQFDSDNIEFYNAGKVKLNPYNQISMYEELDILTLEEWAEHETPDFDDKIITVAKRPEKLKTSISHNENMRVISPSSKSLPFSKLVEDGIFWSSELEAAVPPGPTDQGILIQMQELRDRKIRSLESPNWLHCGREKNRFVHFEDGSNACVRYRGPDHAEFVQGELMAFYLARLLGITNTPAVVLSETNTNQWKMLPNLEKQNWTGLNKEAAVVALIEWLPDLTKTTMPYLLLNKLKANESQPNPIDGPELKRLASNEQEGLDENVLSDLVQWSDLIIFDYLTGNYDRVASMQDGAYNEKRPAILHETIHNLAKSSKTESLWLLDNESAFLDAYSLLYAGGGNYPNGKKFQRFHQDMLETTCVFRRKTVNRLYALYKNADPAQLLLRFVSDNEPLFKTQLPTIHENSPFMKHFRERVEKVWKWIRKCQLSVNQYE